MCRQRGATRRIPNAKSDPRLLVPRVPLDGSRAMRLQDRVAGWQHAGAATCVDWLCQRLTGFFDNLIKGFRIVNGNLREHFAIQFDIGLFQSIDEFAVSQAAHATGRIDTCNPQTPEIAFANATIPVRIRTGANQRFLDGSQQPSAASDIALGFFEQSPLGPGASCTLGCSHRIALSSGILGVGILGGLRRRGRKNSALGKSRIARSLASWDVPGPLDHESVILPVRLVSKNIRRRFHETGDLIFASKYLQLVAVLAQCLLDFGFHARRQGGCPAQIASPLFAQAKREVTGPRLAMHRFALCGQAKSLLGSLVRFHFGHRNSSRRLVVQAKMAPDSQGWPRVAGLACYPKPLPIGSGLARDRPGVDSLLARTARFARSGWGLRMPRCKSRIVETPSNGA